MRPRYGCARGCGGADPAAGRAGTRARLLRRTRAARAARCVRTECGSLRMDVGSRTWLAVRVPAPPRSKRAVLGAAVEEIERHRDREQEHEQDADECDRRRAGAVAARGLVLERLRGLDRVLDGMDDRLRLLLQEHRGRFYPAGVSA